MPAPDHPTLPTPCYRGCGRMLRCRLCMGYGARARVQVGIRTEVEPVWIHTPSLAPVSLPFTMLGPLPCAHLAQNPPSRCDANAVFYPDLRHRAPAPLRTASSVARRFAPVLECAFVCTSILPPFPTQAASVSCKHRIAWPHHVESCTVVLAAGKSARQLIAQPGTQPGVCSGFVR